MTGDVNQEHLQKLDKLPAGWAEASVNDIVKMISTNGKKLPQKKYMEKAEYPVIDQGQGFIGGYHEDESLLIDGEPPYVVFGDHSRAFKFPNFKFIPGADGVKIMQPIGVDPKWAFYMFQAIRLPDKGYARHFQYLKESYLPVPPLEQQKRIVAKIEELFSHIDAGIAALKKAKQLLKQYRQSVLKAAVTGELTKQWREENKDKLEPASQLLERILQERRQKWEAQQLEQFKAKGKVPKDDGWKGKYPEPNIDVEKFFDEPDSWAWAEIGTVTDMLSGHAFKKSEYTDSGVRLFQIANVSFGLTKWDEVEHLPESYLEDWKNLSLSEGDILMALNRPLLSKRLKISRLSKSDVPAILYQRVGKFQFYSELISDYFLIYMQSHFYINRLEEQLQGVNIPFINKGKLLETPISIPSSVAEMEVIVEKVNSKLDSIGRMENEIEGQLRKAAQNKQSILASAFSGGLVEGLDSDGSAQELLEEIRRQHVLNATKEKLTKKQRPSKKKAVLMSKKKIIDVLKVSEQALSPEKLFDLIGADGSSPDEVEEFYIELKATLADKHVVIEPVLDVNVKKGDLISYKVET
jgi:type I restriction enzyme S subunit